MKIALHELRMLPKPILLLCAGIGLLIFVSLAVPAFLIFRKEAIHHAARTGDVREVEEILDRHPDWIENRNRLDLTPFQDAVMEGQTELAKVLIARGANVQATWNLVRTGDGEWTALHIAANYDRPSLIEVLIQAGVDVNALSLRGETAYDVAFRGGHWEVLDVLHKHGGIRSEELRRKR